MNELTTAQPTRRSGRDQIDPKGRIGKGRVPGKTCRGQIDNEAVDSRSTFSLVHANEFLRAMWTQWHPQGLEVLEICGWPEDPSQNDKWQTGNRPQGWQTDSPKRLNFEEMQLKEVHLYLIGRLSSKWFQHCNADLPDLNNLVNGLPMTGS